jgi:hypothetical protein
MQKITGFYFSSFIFLSAKKRSHKRNCAYIPKDTHKDPPFECSIN